MAANNLRLKSGKTLQADLAIVGLGTRVPARRADHAALMCAEAVPWRCHRSLIADALVVHGIRAEEIINATRRQVHTLTPFASVDGMAITYPPQAPLS
ncbi:MAG TPA: DUF488 family protein [Rhodocyclaceae bacterium]|nr:DUF488 family protein [Rhodocyclaceae bacterium]